MPVRKINFQFRAKLSEVEANFIKTGIFLPGDIIRDLPKGRVRVEGTMNGAPFALAVLNMRDGSRFFSVSAHLRRAARIKLGDSVDVRFKVVDPDKVDVPEELEAVLAQDEDAMKAWEKLTIGYRRTLIHYVTSVKNVDSRIKRSIDLMERAKAGLLHGQKKPSARK
jgi:hypothetical protein